MIAVSNGHMQNTSPLTPLLLSGACGSAIVKRQVEDLGSQYHLKESSVRAGTDMEQIARSKTFKVR